MTCIKSIIIEISYISRTISSTSPIQNIFYFVYFNFKWRNSYKKSGCYNIKILNFGINALILVQNSSSSIISGVTMNSSGKDTKKIFFEDFYQHILDLYRKWFCNYNYRGSCVTLVTDRGEGVVRCNKCILS